MSHAYFGNGSYIVRVSGDTREVYPLDGIAFRDKDKNLHVGGEAVAIAKWKDKVMYADVDAHRRRKTVNAVAMTIVIQNTGDNPTVYGDVLIVRKQHEVKKDAQAS